MGAALLVQIARLLWVIATPVGPLGNWAAPMPAILPVAQREGLLRSYDPFFPLAASGDGAAAVTSLALKLYGVRVNEGSGLGSAILSGPDGRQSSFAVGEEIQPGVILKAVAFDHVFITRSGRDEQLFIDQSAPLPQATAPLVPPAAVAPTAAVRAPIQSDDPAAPDVHP